MPPMFVFYNIQCGQNVIRQNCLIFIFLDIEVGPFEIYKAVTHSEMQSWLRYQKGWATLSTLQSYKDIWEK